MHDRILWVLKSSARSALLNFEEFQTKTCQEVAPAVVIESREEALGLLNTLKEELCRGEHREEKQNC
jgi:hypothetical protein